MLFHSYQFMLFFPVVTLLFFVMPGKLKTPWLLIASYFFYMCWNPRYALLILTSTVITWGSGILMSRVTNDGSKSPEEVIRRKKQIVALSFTVNLLILFVFKYMDFAVDNLNRLLMHLGATAVNKPFDVLLPVGISFYTFQALGYTVDVYRGDVEPERNFIRYALFVSFFPQLVAGPIERSGKLLTQIKAIPEKKHLWDTERILSGLILMLWGIFLKLVLAERLSMIVDTVFPSYYLYGTLGLSLGAVSFGLQIYCDFCSYSTIAVGAAKVLDLNLMENFEMPYFATSIRDFWRRWHISLSTWFRDYLYIPLGGNCGVKSKTTETTGLTFTKNRLRKYRNILITFLVSGLWHGANWTFVFWGGLHGCYQIIGEVLEPVRRRVRSFLKVDETTWGYRVGRILGTAALVNLAWIFFRAETITDAFAYIGRMFTRWDGYAFFDPNAYDLGLSHIELNILIVSLLLLLAVSLLRTLKGITIDAAILKQNTICRFIVLFCLLMFVIIYGIYGPGAEVKDFIYFQF